MKKRWIGLVLLLVVSLAPVQAAHGYLVPWYKMEPVEWLDRNAEYTLIMPKTPIIADPLMLALMGSEDDDIGPVADTEQTTVSGQSLLEQGLYVLSVSPDGQRILCSAGARLLLMEGSTLRAVALNLSRCAATQREGMEQSIRYASQPAPRLVGSEGFRWSPDGKYICLLNDRQTIQQMKPVPLMLIDAEKGEMFSIRAYQTSNLHERATAMQGVFSPDSRYLYYTEFVDRTARLCRYDLNTQKHELLFDTLERLLGYPALGMNENGEILCAMGLKDNALLTFKEGADGWVSAQKALPGLGVSYFAASGQGAIMEQVLPKEQTAGHIHHVKVNGQMWRVSAEVQTEYGIDVHFCLRPPYESREEALADMQKDSEKNPQALCIRHVAMSPAGSRYLLVIESQDNKKAFRYFLMNAQSDEAPAVVEVPEEMKTGRPFFQRGNPWYAAGMVFLTEDLLLAPGEANHTQLYRLECHYHTF